MVPVESEQYYDIYADKDTGVMYLYVYTGRGFGSGLTVMLNADGTPKIWQGEEQEKKLMNSENLMYNSNENGFVTIHKRKGKRNERT